MVDIKRIPFTPPALPPNFSGDIEAYSASLNEYLSTELGRILNLVGGSLRWQNLRSQLCLHSITVAANTAFTVTHNLGKIPEFYIWNTDTSGAVIHATAANKANWTNQTIELECNLSGVAPNIALTLLVM